MQPSSNKPSREYDHCEIDHDERYTLLALSDLNRVEMHMVLGSEVRVELSVDVFEVPPARVLVQAIGLRIWPVESSTLGS